MTLSHITHSYTHAGPAQLSWLSQEVYLVSSLSAGEKQPYQLTLWDCCRRAIRRQSHHHRFGRSCAFGCFRIREHRCPRVICLPTSAAAFANPGRFGGNTTQHCCFDNNLEWRSKQQTGWQEEFVAKCSLVEDFLWLLWMFVYFAHWFGCKKFKRLFFVFPPQVNYH